MEIGVIVMVPRFLKSTVSLIPDFIYPLWVGGHLPFLKDQESASGRLVALCVGQQLLYVHNTSLKTLRKERIIATQVLRGFILFQCGLKWQGKMTECIHIMQTRRQREQRGKRKRQGGRWRERGQGERENPESNVKFRTLLLEAYSLQLYPTSQSFSTTISW